MIEERRRWLGLAVIMLTAGVIGLHAVTPAPGIPVGTAIAETTGSMGASEERLLLYVDREPSIGETVVWDAERFVDRDHYVHHRVVARTPHGWLTAGDAVPHVDQAMGWAYLDEQNLIGVTVLSIPLGPVRSLLGLGGAGVLLVFGSIEAVGGVERLLDPGS